MKETELDSWLSRKILRLWQPRNNNPETPAERSFYVRLALAFLLLTAAFSTYWSYLKLMDNDEFLSYYGDSTSTLADVILVQLRYPISLDPPAYHILSHLSMDVFGRNEMAMRVPALLGFLLFQWALFLFVRCLAGSRAATVAMLLPLAGTTYFYSVVGRPYGLLLGLYGMSLVCWQCAARRVGVGESRWLPLAGIAMSLGLAITSHYFGILILIPIALAELACTIARRRLDYGILGAIFAGMLSVAIILPFRKAVLVYQQHYYITQVEASIIRDAYRGIFFHFFGWSASAKSILSAAVVAALLVVVGASIRRFRSRASDEPAYEWAALLAIAALPVFGYLFGRFVTHTMEVRYVMAWQFAAFACAGISMERLLRRSAVFCAAIACILLAGWLLQDPAVEFYRSDKVAKLASMYLPPELGQQILSDPKQRIYVQSLENFFNDEHYQPDQRIRERLSFIYGENQEIAWLQHNTNAVTAENMKHFTNLSLVSYSQFLADPDLLLIIYHNGWEWVEQDLKARDRQLVFLGPVLRGALVEVQPSPEAAVQASGSFSATPQHGQPAGAAAPNPAKPHP